MHEWLLQDRDCLSLMRSLWIEVETEASYTACLEVFLRTVASPCSSSPAKIRRDVLVLERELEVQRCLLLRLAHARRSIV
jgi:hypothetical protein